MSTARDDETYPDFDLYKLEAVRTSVKKIKGIFTKLKWKIDQQRKEHSVTKFTLTKKLSDGGNAKLQIDYVEWNKTFKSGTDLGNFYLSNNGRRCGLFRTHDCPPLDFTLEQLLSSKPECHVLRAGLWPKTRDDAFLDSDDSDKKFRKKLFDREMAGWWTLKKSWPVRKIIKPGANRDGYWTIDDMMLQCETAIDAFESSFPNCVGVFGFDHSSNHMAFPDDALRVSSLIKGDKSNAKDRPAPSRKGWFIDKDENLQEHDMNWTDEDGQVRRKGMLEERGRETTHENGKAKSLKCRACTLERSKETLTYIAQSAAYPE